MCARLTENSVRNEQQHSLGRNSGGGGNGKLEDGKKTVEGVGEFLDMVIRFAGRRRVDIFLYSVRYSSYSSS
jgi:hypothetical protein